MKSLRFLVLLLLIVAGLSSGKSCQAETTEEMLSACRALSHAKVSNGAVEVPTDYDSGVCWGAFSVLMELLTAIDAKTKEPILRVHMPDHVTETQLIAIFVQYADKHPETYTKHFEWVAINAIVDAFRKSDK
jgi:hypothetical protein